jgi:hydroxyacylglutathione hydrolase
MMRLKSFTFNPFQQNTYLIWDETSTAAIIDPGNHSNTEHIQLQQFISDNKLSLKRCLLTHAHIDHVLGCDFIHRTYGLLPEVHQKDLFFIERMSQTANMYGIPFEQAPAPEMFIEEGQIISVGTVELKCLFTPGHSPGSISFYNAKAGVVISGDVLFMQSIGRTDLPMGNHETLIQSIQTELFSLPDTTKVYSGHGPATTIGNEKLHNPFLT